MKKALILGLLAGCVITGCGTEASQEASVPIVIERETETVEKKEERPMFLSDMGPGSLVPYPAVGTTTSGAEYADCIFVDVLDVTQDDFENYVKDCARSGFDVDYIQFEDYYWAMNADGYELTISFCPEDETTKEHYSISVFAPAEEG